MNDALATAVARTLCPLAILAALVAARGAPASDGDALVWPAGEPARHAQAFFAAFGGDEAAMRAFWTVHGSAAALAQRPVEPRLEVWHDLRDRFGTLTPQLVLEAREAYVQVRALDAHGQLLDIGFPCDAAAPHGLIALEVREAGSAAPATPTAPVEDQGPPPDDRALAAALLARADSLAKRGEFSGALVLDKDGVTLARGAWGAASRESGEPNRAG
ncbi:MAG TPA: hypothetical protein VMH61_00680, partial [Candidatus Acidoferrales bacterium]|nr:hypothetical protein [Candidatus Acidoferrales bacterium]